MSKLGKGLEVKQPIAVDTKTRKAAEALLDDVFAPETKPKKPVKRAVKPKVDKTEVIYEPFMFKLPRDTHKALKLHVLNIEEKTTMSKVVEGLIEEYLKKHKND